MSSMTEIYDGYADTPGNLDNPEVLASHELEVDTTITLDEGAAADNEEVIQGSAAEGTFGELAEDDPILVVGKAGDDSELYDDEKEAAVTSAREQVSAAFNEADEELAPGDGGTDNPNTPRPPIGGSGGRGNNGEGGEDGIPEGGEPEERDSVNDQEEPEDADEPEEVSAAVKSEWVETRSLDEIKSLMDPDKYSNEDLAVLWKNGDPEAAGAILSRNSGFFHSIALRHTWADEHKDIDDVKQQFELLFLGALKKFDPGRGVKALTFAGNIAETELIDGRQPSRDSVGAQPIIRQIERKIFALDRLLENSGGHEPLTDAQLARFKLTDDQLAAVRRVEARVQAQGYSPLTDDEVISIFHNPEVDSSSHRYLSSNRLQSVRQHTALTDKLLSLDHTGPEYSAWLGDNAGKLSDDETTSHARPVLEVPQVSVEEVVEDKIAQQALREVLPRALETLDPKEREILYLRTVEGLALNKVADRYAETGEELSSERVRQLHAGIVDATRNGSSRGALFRHMIANAIGYDTPERQDGPKVGEVLHARQILTDLLPHLSDLPRSILNEYFILDGRDTTEGISAVDLARQHDLPYADLNRMINSYVSSVAGSLDVGQMRQAMLDFAPIRHPLTDDERRKWGIES